MNGCFRRRYRRRRLQSATGVDTSKGSESTLQEALQAKASTVRYGSRYRLRQQKYATGGATDEGAYSPLQSSPPRHMCFCARALRAFGGLRSVAPSAHAQADPLRGFGDAPALRLLGVGALSCPPCLSLRALSTRAEGAPPSAPFRRHRPELPPEAAVHMATQAHQQNGA